MTELSVLLLGGLLRVILGALLISEGKFLNARFLLLSFLIGFVFSSIVTVMLTMLLTPFILSMGLLTGDQIPVQFLLFTYLIGELAIIFGIELTNNQIQLGQNYTRKRITMTTIYSFFFSIAVVLGWFWMEVR